MTSKILKGSISLLSAQSIIKVISFFYTIFLARKLGVADFGLYILALSYFSLVSSISDLGINRFLIREAALQKDRLFEILNTIILIRLIFISLFLIILRLAFFLFDPNIERSNIILMALLAIIPQAVSLTLDSILIGSQHITLSAIGKIFLSLSTTLISVVLLLLNFGVLGAVIGIVAGEVSYAIFTYLAGKSIGVHLIYILKKKEISDILKGSLPYSLLGLLGIIYFKIDSLLLSYMKGVYETGIYGAGYKFLEAITFVPNVVAIALFPFLAQKGETWDKAILKSYIYKIAGVMGAVGLVISIAYELFLPVFISIFLPSYQLSIQVIMILSLAIPFMFIHIPLSQFLLSQEKYLKSILGLSIINVAFNVSLNILFIPSFGQIAASWVTVLSDIFSLGTLLYVLRKELFINARP